MAWLMLKIKCKNCPGREEIFSNEQAEEIKKQVETGNYTCAGCNTTNTFIKSFKDKRKEK